jgi:protein-histidine N-methyltransferase
VFQRAFSLQGKFPIAITVADYNPSVLNLVTLPNFLLAWALHQAEQDTLVKQALEVVEGELEVTTDIKTAFVNALAASHISLSFLSGGWSPDFVELLYEPQASPPGLGEHQTLIVGAETIYSPFAQAAFTEILLQILQREATKSPSRKAVGVIAAKRLYFGVGGSLDDFVDNMRRAGARVDGLREETEGVRRGVVQCLLGN